MTGVSASIRESCHPLQGAIGLCKPVLIVLLLAFAAQAAPNWEAPLREGRTPLIVGKAGSDEWKLVWNTIRAEYPALHAENLSDTLQLQAGAADIPASATELHVGAAHPLKTLHAARDAARRINGPVQIVVHAGRYEFDKPLTLGPEDSNTSYEAAEGENATLTAGRRVTTRWRTDDGKVWYTDIPEARVGAWAFRNLFVDGRREQIARFPNALADTNDERGWLRNQGRRSNYVLAGLQQAGDWASFRFAVPRAGEYALWVSYATARPRVGKLVRFSVDGRELAPVELPPSGNWRKVARQRIGTVELKEGEHALRVSHAGPNRVMNRIHFDWFLFTPELGDARAAFTDDTIRRRQHALVQAEDTAARTGGESSMQFQAFAVETGKKHKSPTKRLCLPRGEAKPVWASAPQAEVWCWVSWGWYNMTACITGVEPGAPNSSELLLAELVDRIRIEGREAAAPIWHGNRFYVFNLIEELDAPGEWFLDYETGRLSYFPREGKDPNNSEIVAPASDRLVEIAADAASEQRAESITFRGLVFEHTDRTTDHPGWRTCPDAAIHLTNAWHCTVEDCEFRAIGGYGVRLFQDSCLNRIAGNHIHDVEAGGVTLSGAIAGRRGRLPSIPANSPSSAFAPLLNLVADNHIHHIGLFKKYVAGVHADPRPRCTAYAPGNVIRHNLIHDATRNGIFLFSNCGGTVIEHNRIERCLLESDDGGPIHLCASHTETTPGIIRGNLLRNAVAYRQGRDEPTRGIGNGVYLDNFTSNMLIRDNVIVGMATAGVFYHHGKNNVAENNIIVDGGRQQLWFTKNWDGNGFARNVVVWDNPDHIYTRFGNMLRPPTPDDGVRFDRNLLWPGRGKPSVNGESLAAWQVKGFERNTLLADPRFVDPNQPELGLRADSPAFAQGFRRIVPGWPAMK